MSPGEPRHFHRELDELKSLLLDMSGKAEDLVRLSIEALLDNDVVKAKNVIRGDDEIDDLELKVDQEALSLLALQQPMARDLRLITMIMKISNDLERVGDHAVNIAHAVTHLADVPRFTTFPEVEEMARISLEMLSDVLDCFVQKDAEGAREVCARDDRVDSLHNSMFRILLTHMMEDPRRIGPAMNFLLVSKNLERIADLATNIGEDVVFLVEGKVIRHGAEEAEGRASSDPDPSPVALS